MEEQKPGLRKGMAAAALVCSAVGLVLWMAGWLIVGTTDYFARYLRGMAIFNGVVGFNLILGFLGIILGAIALNNARERPGVYGGGEMATVAIILGSGALLLGLVTCVLVTRA